VVFLPRVFVVGVWLLEGGGGFVVAFMMVNV
jgi:hypothetical protein